jgi:hypothetical protein
MTPFDFTHALTRVNERLQTVRTAAASMLLLAFLALAGAYAVAAIQPRLAKIMAALSVAGSIGAIAAARILSWRRDDLYDDILLSGFRHVGGPDVARRAADLVSRSRRCQLASTLERFVESARDNRRTAVPLHRKAVCEMGPRVLELASLLRDERPVEPAGMVLVRRLVTDGAGSPLFHAVTGVRDLERALDRILSELVPEQPAVAYELPLAA